MKLFLIGPILFSLGFSIPYAEVAKTDITSDCRRSASERLRDHFDDFEMQASVIINSTEDWPDPNVREMIPIGKYKIEWLPTAGTLADGEATVRIDGTTVPISRSESLNVVSEGKKVKLNFVNRWDQIRLYSFPEGDVISISISNHPCTGLMCSAAGQLIFDVKSKRANFFSTFGVNPEVRLLAFGRGQTSAYYLSKSFEGDFHGHSSSAVTYELFETDESGQYVRRSKTNGKPFYLKHTIQPNGSKKADTLEENWPVDVGCREGF
jgi:hypothetical protein